MHINLLRPPLPALLFHTHYAARMYQPHFVNQRLHVGWRRDAAVPVFYAGRQPVARPASSRPGQLLSGSLFAPTAKQTASSLILESVLPGNVVEKVKPGEVAWLPFFNHTYVQGDTAKEKQEVRDARLHAYWSYMSEDNDLRLADLESQLRQPGSGPHGTFLLEKAKEWKRSHSDIRSHGQSLHTPTSSTSHGQSGKAVC